MPFWTIVFGLIGARLYYDVQSGWWFYLTHPQHIFAFWEGGMAFFGAIFASLIVLIVMARRHHILFWDLLDAGVLFGAAGQPIGRLGNVMNGEILGPPSNLPWAIRYTNPASMAPHLGVAYQPANLYEAIGTLLILAVLLYLRRRGVPSGILGLAYLGALEVPDLERERLDGRADRRARIHHLRVAVARQHLGRGNRLQAEVLADVALNRGVDVRVRAHRARELADRDRRPGARESLAIAPDLHRPQRELGAERRRLGVYAVRATDHRCVAELVRPLRDRVLELPAV